MTPVTISSIAIIIFAAIIHASYQLSVSVLTLLSGHSIGKKTAHRRVLGLMNSFVAGALVLTLMMVSSAAYYISIGVDYSESTEQLVAAIACGLMVGLGLATWAFYFRKEKGTALWLPRGFAEYLSKRAKKTKNAHEAFSLGMASVVAEIIFIIGPIIAGSLAIITMPDLNWKIFGILLYTTISLVPLAIVTLLVGGGKNVTQLQRWRENNKRFLQFSAGGSLLILATFIFVDRVIGIASYGGLW